MKRGNVRATKLRSFGASLERAASLFRAAGDVERLRLLVQLGDERCVSDLAASTGEGMSTISQRLKILLTEGLVRRRREGKKVLYVLTDAHVVDFLGSALEHARELGAP